MITNENAFVRLSMVGRLMSHQQAKGETAVNAAEKLREILPKEYHDSIELVEKMINGENIAVSGYGSGSIDIFNRLADIIRHNNGNLYRLFESMQLSLRDAVSQAREYWSGFNSLISYLVTVMVIAFVIVNIFVIKVMPTMKAAFDSFGAELPLFTKMVVTNHAFYSALMSLIVLVIGASLWLAFYVKKRIAEFLPLDKWCDYIPVIKNLKETYGYFLLVNYLDVFIRAGLSDRAAFDQAFKLAAIDINNIRHVDILQWATALNVSVEINSLAEEISYQKGQIGSYFGRAMISVRESLTLFTQVFLGIIIGMLLIAMYLPIFMLGSTIGG